MLRIRDLGVYQMMEYVKPDYEVMEFAANEYVAYCEEIYADLHCETNINSIIDAEGTLKHAQDNQKSSPYGDYYHFDAVTDDTGSNNYLGGGGQLWLNFKTADGYYAFTGSINDGWHTESSTDEYVTTGEYGSGGVWKTDISPTNPCSCKFIWNYGHHHVAYVTTGGNRS